MPCAERHHSVATHEHKAGGASLSFYIVPQFGGVAILIQTGQKTLSEEYFAVGLIVVRADGQNAVVGEPNTCVGVIEWVAVLFAYRAMCGKAKMNDTGCALLSQLDGLQEAGEVEGFEVVAVSVGKSDAVGVGSVDGFHYRYGWRFHARWYV